MIKSYVRYQRKLFFCVIWAVLLFSIFEFLMRISFYDITYVNLVFLFVIAVFLIFDYLKFNKRNKDLLWIKENISIDRQRITPGENKIEKEYENIIIKLYETIDDTINQMNSVSLENEEYYTLWIHQIKTPISAIHFLLENMEENAQKAVLEAELFKIEQYVELALQFIKIRNIESDLVINQYVLKDMINQSVKKYSNLFIHKGLGVNVTGCDCSVTTDSKWFSFILEQILSNAIKYTNKGIIQIYANKKEEGFLLTIEDSGIGIRKEDINRVFEKGYTGFNGRMDKKASGIGLYLAKKVATALNHNITIESQVGIGTKVHIFIKEYS